MLECLPFSDENTGHNNYLLQGIKPGPADYQKATPSPPKQTYKPFGSSAPRLPEEEAESKRPPGYGAVPNIKFHPQGPGAIPEFSICMHNNYRIAGKFGGLAVDVITTKLKSAKFSYSHNMRVGKFIINTVW